MEICEGETSPRLFFKYLRLGISLDQQSEVLYRLFLLYDQVMEYQNILKVRCWSLAFISYKAFL